MNLLSIDTFIKEQKTQISNAMAQIIESRFRILKTSDEEVYLSDVETGPPVWVEVEDESYDESLQNDIEELESGNVIEAEIRSKSIAYQDDIWLFLSISVEEETRFHFIDHVDDHPDLVEKLKDHLNDIDQNSARKFMKSGDDPLGYITVAESQGGDLWTGLQSGTNSHEVDLQMLGKVDDPPHEVIYTRTSDEQYLVFYHFGWRDSNLAQSVIDRNL